MASTTLTTLTPSTASTILTSVHPETPEDASWSFQFIHEQFAARSRKARDYAEAYFTYVAQEIPKIDVGIAAKGHLWMETNYELRAIVFPPFQYSIIPSLSPKFWLLATDYSLLNPQSQTALCHTPLT
jgi:hypothetical protein